MVARPRHQQDALEISPPDSPEFSQLSLWDAIHLDFTTHGLSTRGHPVEILRPLLPDNIRPIADVERVKHNAIIEFVGAVIARQKPGTAKGVVFLLMEDESGTANVIVNPRLYKQQRLVVRGEPILRLRGRVERHGDVVNVIALNCTKLPRDLQRKAPRHIVGKHFG
jgi:error-prone DNA polymerase